jgi:RimJ/RimL family protein N-acetyltransferase
MDNIQTEKALATTKLESERLILRGFEPADFDAYADYHQNAEVYRFLYQEPPKGDAQRAAFDAQLGRSFEADGDAMHFAVVVKDGGDLVGEVILKLASKAARQGEVGYIFNPRFAGRGYATEALKRLVDFAFDELYFHRLFARLDAKNHGSAGVVERLGFRREAHLIENLCFNDTWGDEYIYAMLRREWGG